jgi:formylglycine-generating enzyme required for sulfatase activity
MRLHLVTLHRSIRRRPVLKTLASDHCQHQVVLAGSLGLNDFPAGAEGNRVKTFVQIWLVVVLSVLGQTPFFRDSSLFAQSPKELTNNIGMRLIRIPAGTFQMGSPANEIDRDDDKEDQHQVTISKPFYIGRTEVTQGEWKKVMGTEPWKGKDYVQEGDDYPAVYVSWNDTVEFCQKLSRREGKTYRLPSESEWEYACRGGTTARFSFGDDETDAGKYAWFYGNAVRIGEDFAHRVAQKKPNPWQLYDMHGNVWEWCGDWYGEYPDNIRRDPRGPDSGLSRVLRGGSWTKGAHNVRCARRDGDVPEARAGGIGFRLVLE